MNMPVKLQYFKNPKNRELTQFELDELARELDAIKQEVLDDLGEKMRNISVVSIQPFVTHRLPVAPYCLQAGSRQHGC